MIERGLHVQVESSKNHLNTLVVLTKFPNHLIHHPLLVPEQGVTVESGTNLKFYLIEITGSNRLGIRSFKSLLLLRRYVHRRISQFRSVISFSYNPLIDDADNLVSSLI